MVTFALPALFSLAFALASSAAPAPEDSKVAEVKAALLNTRGSSAAPLAARDDPKGTRAVDIDFAKYTIAQQIGSSPLGHWESIGGDGKAVHLAMDGGNKSVEMMQYYMFKQEGDWPPTDLGWSSKDSGSVEELARAGEIAGKIEKTVKCAIVVKQGKDGMDPTKLISQWTKSAPYFATGFGADGAIEDITCIEKW